MSWEKKKLGDLCSITKGKIGISKAISGEYPLVVTSEARKSHNEFHFEGEAVVIPLVSSTGHGHRSLKRIHYQTGKFAVGSILCAVIPNDSKILNAEFLYRFLDLNREKELVSRMRGMANVTLPMKEIANIEVPLPPLEEQIKFVSEYKKLETANNTLSTEITTQLDLVKQLRQSFLREAMQGKLTSKWREQNSPPLEGCLKGGVVNKRNSKNYFSLPYNPKLKQRAKDLRKAGNLSEVLFWNEVKRKQFKGLDFDRQKIIGNYIVDFYCPNCQVVIEIDGSSHDNKQEYDAKRDAYLESLGLTIIHIDVIDIKKNLAYTMNWLSEHPALETPCSADISEETKNHPVLSDTPPKEGNWETASELLKRIKAEKEQLIKEKKIKKQKPLPPISKEEIPFEIPENWVWCRLGEVTTYGSSQKADPNKFNNDTWVLDLEDIEKETSRLLNKVRFNERNSLSTKSVFEFGDVLYSKLRPYLDKVIVADEKGVCTTEILPLKCFANTNPYFFRYALKRPDFISFVNSVTKGMKMPRLGTEEGRKALIPFPPLSEQILIANKLDELMAYCDSLEESIKNSQTQNEMLLGQVLREALEPTSGKPSEEKSTSEKSSEDKHNGKKVVV